MFTRILVPLDGSPQAAAALPLARAVLGSSSAKLLLVRVADDPTSLPLDSSGEARESERYLNRIAAELRGGPTSVETRVLIGSPGIEIVNAVGLLGADLVVMATHSRGGLGRLIFGSVAEHVVAHSRVPVMVVRPGGRRVGRIGTLLVPLDGSPGGKLALASATRLARQHGARLELIGFPR
jgi:nucleotide-binding universal stress UspA family protein